MMRADIFLTEDPIKFEGLQQKKYLWEQLTHFLKYSLRVIMNPFNYPEIKLT